MAKPKKPEWPKVSDVKEAIFLAVRFNGGEVNMRSRGSVIVEALADHFELPPKLRKLPHPTAKTQWANKVHWAKLALVKEGRLDSEAPYGVWRIAERPKEKPKKKSRSLEKVS